MDDDFAPLLEAARRGEEWAWSRLYRELAAPVRGYLAARGMSDADEAVGEVFVHAARGLPRFEGSRDEFRVRLFVLARRLVDDDPRSVSGQGWRAGSGQEAHVPPHVRSVIDQLDPHERDALLLGVVGGLGPGHVAAVLGVTEGEAFDLQHRALGSINAVLF